MHKKLTISVDESVYDGLHQVVGRGAISQFIEDLVRPYVSKPNLDQMYRQKAKDEAGELEALEWSEGVIGDVADEPW